MASLEQNKQTNRKKKKVLHDRNIKVKIKRPQAGRNISVTFYFYLKKETNRPKNKNTKSHLAIILQNNAKISKIKKCLKHLWAYEKMFRSKLNFPKDVTVYISDWQDPKFVNTHSLAKW